MPMTLEIKSEFLKQFMRSPIDRGTFADRTRRRSGARRQARQST
jgi:hypothetical protein